MADGNYDTGEDARRTLARIRAKAVGPYGSSVVLGGGELDVFFKVKWGRLKPVEELARERGDEGMDSYTGWALHGGPHGHAATLEIGWPDIGVQVFLYFPLPKWHAELDLVNHAGGRLILCPMNSTAIEAIKRGVGVQAQTDLLPTILAS